MRCSMKLNFALFALFVPVVEASDVVETPWFSEENPSNAFCPIRGISQSLVTGVICSGKYCDNIKLQCTYKKGYVNGVESWTPFFSEEQGLQYCPGRTVMIGMRCRGSYCDDISLRCLDVSSALYPNKHCDETDWVSEEHGGRKVIPRHSYPIGVRCGGSYCDNKRINYCYERGYGPNTAWFSEENNGQGICPKEDGSQTMLMGLSCSGSYCDNLKVHCGPMGAAIDGDAHVVKPHAVKTYWRVGKTHWTNWFSEETPSEMMCDGNEILTGVRCRGAYCDDLSLQCTEVTTGLKRSNCASTGWFSEESEGYAGIPDGAYPIGIRCRGDYCDDKVIRYCF